MNDDDDEDLSGRTIGGRYELIERIGSGGAAAIYRASFVPGDTEVALKLLKPGGPAASRTRFRHEFRALHQFKHRSLVRALDYQDDGEHVFYTMPLLRGPTLAARVLGEGTLSVAEVFGLALELCEVAAFIHGEGTIHRDLSPRNVIIEDNGIKLIDFGLVKLLPDFYARPGRHLTSPELRLVTRQAVGSPGFSAPEIWAGTTVKKSDVWSIAALLYFALTGRPPYRDHKTSDLPEDLPESVPRELQAILFSALLEDIDERLSLTEFWDLLKDQAAVSRPTPVEGEGTGRARVRVASRPRRHGVGPLAAGAIAVGLSLICSVATWVVARADLSGATVEAPAVCPAPTMVSTGADGTRRDTPARTPATPIGSLAGETHNGTAASEYTPGDDDARARARPGIMPAATATPRRADRPRARSRPVLDAEVVRERLDGVLDRVRLCVAKSFGHTPNMVVRIRVRVDGETGQIRRIKFHDSILQPAARTCARAAVEGVTFPGQPDSTTWEHAFVL